MYWYLPLWERFSTLQTSKSFQLITIFSLKQPDKEMLPFSLYCRTDFQRSHLLWWQVLHPVSLVDSSVIESVVCIQSVKLWPPQGSKGYSCGVMRFSNNVGFTSFLGKGAFLPELDELYLKIMLGRVCNFDCTCITLYLRWLGKIT